MKADKKAQEAEKKAALEAAEAARNAERQAVAEAERLRAFRDRLYDRGSATTTFSRHTMSTDSANKQPSQRPEITASLSGSAPAPQTAARLRQSAPGSVREDAPTPLVDSLHQPVMTTSKKHRSYRFKILLVGLAFFVVAFVVSSVFFFFGNNTISSDNIDVEVTGPLALSGGDALTMQVMVSNKNEVPIESATLIVQYPPGTQSISEVGRELYTDRIELNQIDPGEVVKVPIQARIFGEENEQKIVAVAIEYRVAGSNARFSREAQPFNFTINTSPIVLSMNTEPSVASGKETALVLTVQSNSATEFSNLLVKITYPPIGFSLTGSEPRAVSGQDTWQIPTLKPGEKYEIIIKGLLEGAEDQKQTFTVSVGVPSDRDRFNLASILSTTASEIRIEPPLIGLDVTIDGRPSDAVVIAPSKDPNISLTFKNPLQTVLYDAKLSIIFSGETFARYRVDNKSGFYEAETRTLSWDAVDLPKLKELKPGESVSVSFNLQVDEDKEIGSSPEFKLAAAVSGRRLAGEVASNVSNSVEKSIKLSGSVEYRSALVYTEGPFENSGPTPPVAGETTEYTLYLRAQAEINPVAAGQVTAILPPYVRWQDRVSEGDDVTYNPTTRTLTWKVEPLAAGAHTEAWVQLAFLPSSSQVGRTPTIVEAQRYSTTDTFTSTPLRADARALTSQLLGEPDSDRRAGEVQD